MPIDFPNTPTVGETFTSGVRTWVWNGTVWDLIAYGAPGDSDQAIIPIEMFAW